MKSTFSRFIFAVLIPTVVLSFATPANAQFAKPEDAVKFSRKQVLQPVALDLNEIISGVSRMARRLIGTDVQLRLDLGPSVSQVLADPAQV